MVTDHFIRSAFLSQSFYHNSFLIPCFVSQSFYPNSFLSQFTSGFLSQQFLSQFFYPNSFYPRFLSLIILLSSSLRSAYSGRNHAICFIQFFNFVSITVVSLLKKCLNSIGFNPWLFSAHFLVTVVYHNFI